MKCSRYLTDTDAGSIVVPPPSLPIPPQPDPNVFRLRIARQPPSKTVYQRILKPFPSVMLVSGNDSGILLLPNIL